MNLAEQAPARGHLAYRIHRRGADGRWRVVEHVDGPNLIVDGGFTALAALLAGTAALRPTHIGFSADSSLVLPSHTSLPAPHLEVLGEVSHPNPRHTRWEGLLPADAANGMAIRKMALVMAGGLLFSAKRREQGAIPKDADIFLDGTWTIEHGGPA